MSRFTLDKDTGNTTPEPHPTFDPDDLPPPDPRLTTWVLDATTIRSTNQSELRSIPAGDELYLARVSFRSTPGRSGSTRASFNGGVSRDTVIKGVQVGETHSIPDAMGRVTFSGVTLRTFEELLNGESPEFIGTVDVLFEDDNTPKSAIVDLMGDLAVAVKEELRDIVEPLDLLNLNTDELGDELDAAVQRVKDSVMPNLGRQIGLFLSSLGNADDRIGFQTSLFIAVDDSMADLIDSMIGSILGSGEGTAGALREQSYQQSYSGSAGSWVVSHRVST
jgi:hypothetical protein